ncbi:hypothetical protein [Nonomuraea salmonea]|uniref:hypothetical protein n=1 Tax=Nonomuraea salmonea TaxID=46181 RepID=UPI002FE830E2
MIPRSRTVSLLALGAICLAGCASEERPVQPQLKPLAMKEQVSNIVKSADGYAVNWAGVLTNANPWHFGEHVVATIVGHDAKGAEVLKLDQPLDAVPPGGSLAFTGQAPASVKPAKVTIQYRPARWRQAARIVSSFQPFPISRVQTLPQKDGSYLITGYVDNPYQMPVSSLVVTAMLRDKSGKTPRRWRHVRGRREGGQRAQVRAVGARPAEERQGRQDRDHRQDLGGPPGVLTRSWRWPARCRCTRSSRPASRSRWTGAQPSSPNTSSNFRKFRAVMLCGAIFPYGNPPAPRQEPAISPEVVELLVTDPLPSVT